MATYYVRPDGSDTNPGTGPSPSQAWQTLTKAFQTVVSGDTVYVAAGIYPNHHNLSFTNNFTATVTIEGDIYGQHFTDIGGGWPLIHPYSAWPSGVAYGGETIALSSRSNITLRRLAIQPSWDFGIYSDQTGNNILIEECIFFGRCTAATVRFNIQSTSGLTIRRCAFLTFQPTAIYLYFPATSTNYTANFRIESCFVLATGWGIPVYITGATPGTGRPGGGIITGCSLITGDQRGVFIDTGNYSTTNPLVVENNLIITANNALEANTSGQMSENYNMIMTTGTVRINVTAGANSKLAGPDASNAIGMPVYGLFPGVGGPGVPMIMPWPDSVLHRQPLSSNAPSLDIHGRPVTNWGAVSVSNAGTMSSAANSDGGSGAALELTGKMCHDLLIPVDPVSTTVSVKVKWDSNHGDTNPPQAQLLAAPELGYSGQTITATAPGTSYQTLTFTAFTPTRKGIVVLRLISRSTSVDGKAWFDTVTVT
jgi:hypothetical protein